jgi:hypothetical protein
MFDGCEGTLSVENLTSKRDARLEDCKGLAAFRTAALKIERDWRGAVTFEQ